MKIGWGWGMAILYGSFVVMILFMVYLSVSQDFHLVTTNYYDEEIKYQAKIDQIKNSAELDKTMKILFLKGSKQIKIKFPFEGVNGKIKLYRPSDATKDQEIAIATDETNTQLISTKNLTSGLWKVQVDWEAARVKYFDEKVIYLN